MEQANERLIRPTFNSLTGRAGQLVIRNLGLCGYQDAFDAMIRFTEQRKPDTPDEIWYLQHPPVYTLGLSKRREHILKLGNIPVIETDRGGQITYHGPGQLLVYCLLDLKRKAITIKYFVRALEQSLMDMLAAYKINAERKDFAPGVYVENKKIAALGIRVKRGCTYHGLALNVNMVLSPFVGINPCGDPKLEVTQLKALGIHLDPAGAAAKLLPHLLKHLQYGGSSNIKYGK